MPPVVVAILLLALFPGRVAHAQFEHVHPKIAAVEIEEPRRARVRMVVRARLTEALDEPELRRLASALRARAGSLDAFGVRFLLPHSADGQREFPPHYAWHLEMPSGEIIFRVNGLTPATASQQIKSLKLSRGERLRGLWVDHYHPLGAVVLIAGPKGLQFMHLATPDRQWQVKDSRHQQRPGHLLEAEHVSSPLGTFAADGVESDRLALLLASDGSLHVFAGRPEIDSRPWLIAQPRGQ